MLRYHVLVGLMLYGSNAEVNDRVLPISQRESTTAIPGFCIISIFPGPDLCDSSHHFETNWWCEILVG